LKFEGSRKGYKASKNTNRLIDYLIDILPAYPVCVEITRHKQKDLPTLGGLINCDKT